MKKKMAFVDLTNFKDWPMGGMLEYELAILPYLAEHFDLDIWGYSVDGHAQDSLSLNGKNYPIRISGNCKTTRRLIPNFWRGLSLLKRQKDFFGKYDVVYAHTGSCLSAISYLVDKNRTKLVYHQHGLNYKADHSLMALLQRPFYQKAQKEADLVFVVSDSSSVAKYALEQKKLSSAQYVPIGSPINLGKFNESAILERIEKRKEKRITNFIYTGRLSAFKNVRLLVQAFAKYVKNVNSEAVFKIAGLGEEFGLIDKIKKDLDVDKNVILLGNVTHSDIYSLLQEADAFLTASGGEGVSVSVLEAFASGLPVICGRVPGLEKQITDHKTGLFVDKMNVDSFYEKMVELNSCQYELAQNCLLEAKKYDAVFIVKKIIDEIEKLY